MPTGGASAGEVVTVRRTDALCRESPAPAAEGGGDAVEGPQERFLSGALRCFQRSRGQFPSASQKDQWSNTSAFMFLCVAGTTWYFLKMIIQPSVMDALFAWC